MISYLYTGRPEGFTPIERCRLYAETFRAFVHSLEAKSIDEMSRSAVPGWADETDPWEKRRIGTRERSKERLYMDIKRAKQESSKTFQSQVVIYHITDVIDTLRLRASLESP